MREPNFDSFFRPLSASLSLWEKHIFWGILSLIFLYSFMPFTFCFLFSISFQTFDLFHFAHFLTLPRKNPKSLVSEVSSRKPHLVLRDLLHEGGLEAKDVVGLIVGEEIRAREESLTQTVSRGWMSCTFIHMQVKWREAWDVEIAERKVLSGCL